MYVFITNHTKASGDKSVLHRKKEQKVKSIRSAVFEKGLVKASPVQNEDSLKRKDRGGVEGKHGDRKS